MLKVCLSVSETDSDRVRPRVGSGRVIEKIFELGSGHKTLTDFELYVRQIAFLDEIMIVLL